MPLPAYTFNEGSFLLGFMADVPNERVLQKTDYLLSFHIEDVIGHGANAQKLPGIMRPELHWDAALPLPGEVVDSVRRRLLSP